MAGKRTLVIDFIVDDKDARAALGRVDKSAATTGQSFGKAATAIKFALAGVATKAVLGFAKDSIDAASDLQESIGKVDAVFGMSSKVIHDWAQGAAENMGISRQAAEEAAGTFGNFLTAMNIGLPDATEMSQTLVQLAVDIAAFNNIENPEDVIVALRSGLAGEAEPLRKFGVQLSAARVGAEGVAMGLADTTTELSAADKAMAAYKIILEDTTTVQGNFADTADNMAGKQKSLNAKVADFKAELGDNFLPIYVTGLQIVTGALDAVVETQEEAATTAEAYDKRIRELGMSAEFMSQRAGLWVGPWTNAEIAVMSYEYALRNNYIPTTRDAADESDDLADSVAGVYSEMRKATDPVFRLIDAQDNYNTALGAYNEVNNNAASSQEDVNRAQGDLLESLIKLKGAQGDANAKFDEAWPVLQEIATAMGLDNREFREWIELLGIYNSTPMVIPYQARPYIGGGSAPRVESFVYPGTPSSLPGGGLGNVRGFASGGIVPGPVGQAQMAVVHGGEEITPPNRQRSGVHIENLNVRASWDFTDPTIKRTIVTSIEEALTEYGAELGI